MTYKRRGFTQRLALWCTLATGVWTSDATAGPWTFNRTDPGVTVWCRWVRPVTVDGRLDDWAAGDFQIVLDQAHLTGNRYGNPPIAGGDADCSGRVAMAWDGTFLYVALRVRDDRLAPIDVKKGYRPPWHHDGLMLHLHAHAGLERTGRYGKEWRRDANDRAAVVGLSYYQADHRPRTLPGRTRYVARACDGGYELEAAVDLKALGYRDPQPGDRLKMAVILVDHDPGVGQGAWGPDAFGQLIWELGPRTNHGNPRDWADLRLMRDRWAADLVAMPQDVGGKTRLCMKGTVDARRAGVVFRGVRVVDADGKRVLAVPASRAVPDGTRLTVTAQVDAPALSDGTYQVHVVTDVAGREHNGRGATRFAVRRGGAPTTVPPRVCVPNPGHFALNARYRRPPTLKNITKATYLDFLKRHARKKIEPAVQSSFKKPWRHAQSPAFLAALMYRETKDPYYAGAAKAGLESMIRWTETQDKEGAVHTELHWLTVDLMRQTGLVGPKDEPRLRRFLVTAARRSCWGHYGWKAKPWRRGAGHSALGPAVSRYYAVHRYPDVPEAKLWTKYYRLTWNDWWQHRDTIYNDTGYRALFLKDVFACAYLTGRDDLFKDPEALKFWDRLLWTVAPNGAVPHYGDTNGWSTEIGMYAFYFEFLATKTRDGRFKYAAHRIFDYIVNHSVNVFDYHMQTDQMIYGIALAHLVADDSVKPKPPGRASRLLTRKELVLIDTATHKEAFGFQVYEHTLGPRDVPDKIIFKSHDRDEALWAMIDVCGDAGHNTPGEPTNVAALVDRESVLTCNQGYFDETPDLHNVVLAEDLEGTRVQGPAMEISVPAFYDRHYASYARVRVANYQGWPIDEERQFLFGRYRFLLLKDVVTFRRPWMCRIGPCWQTQQVGPETGPHWANTYVENLFLTGLGLGRGFHRWKNPAWDLLVFHPPQKGCELEVVNRYDEQPFRQLPVRLRYVWRGMANKGERRHFTTLLLPHDPTPTPSDVVKGIEVLADTVDLTAIRAHTDRYYDDWMVLNDTGRAVKVGPIETDARQLHLWVHQYKGKLRGRHVMAEGATFVTFHGKPVAKADKGKRIDTSF